MAKHHNPGRNARHTGHAPPAQHLRTAPVPPNEQQQAAELLANPTKFDKLPVRLQEIHELYQKAGQFNPYFLRLETMKRIEKITKRPILCYVTQTHDLPEGLPASVLAPFIYDGDLTPFAELLLTGSGNDADIFLVSNGGSPEATERMVRLLRERFKSLRFIVPANAYSAATLMCFAGDEIIMDWRSTLGPIDPQVGGVPARAILRAFEDLEERLKQEGPRALTTYMPLISKYDLHILEICKSAQELTVELAKTWLSEYMLKCDEEDEKVLNIVDFLSNYDVHKSHARSIGRDQARELGLAIANLEDLPDIVDLVRSLYNQYEWWFMVSTFYKMFENTTGVSWGRQLPLATGPTTQPQPTPSTAP